ncbi:PREDICTED: uncharacterized protein LOC106302468 [Brassica oleracea var. oleracea]|uniref:uncharacterized protein LOC106302468 n=1 Tax=Brassica oleracea var. oleracea TaxID=109376 RepID=UPI0006A6CC43|nr:PREDICTED: uncharacterized protein LOC106302468 [Brassica oleracea var. oleracea]
MVNQTKPRNDLLVIELTIQNIDVARVLIDTGSSANIIFKNTLERMKIDPSEIAENPSPLVGLSRETTMALGTINLTVKAGTMPKSQSNSINVPSLPQILNPSHNRNNLGKSEGGTTEILEEKREPTCEPVVSVCLDEAFPERSIEIGANLHEPLRTKLITCLKKNLHTFAWGAEDKPGIDINITNHELNIDPTFKPVK